MQVVEDLKWRYAVKKYDASKRISEEDIETIKQVLQLVPTSYGLQPLKFIFVKNPAVREELFEHSYNQASITEASHLLVMCSYYDLEDDIVDTYMNNTAYTRQVALEQVLGFGSFIKKTIGSLSEMDRSVWMAKQAYIALGLLMQTCAHLRIDSTPMEGFDAEEYERILGLKERNLKATLVVPLGYRHEEDRNQHLKKVRRPLDELFEEV